MSIRDYAARLEIENEAGIDEMIIAIPGDYMTDREIFAMADELTTQPRPDTLGKSLDRYRSLERLTDHNMANWLGINAEHYTALKAAMMPDSDRAHGSFDYYSEALENDITVIATNAGIDAYHRDRLVKILFWNFHRDRGDLRATIAYWHEKINATFNQESVSIAHDASVIATLVKDILREMDSLLY